MVKFTYGKKLILKYHKLIASFFMKKFIIENDFYHKQNTDEFLSIGIKLINSL